MCVLTINKKKQIFIFLQTMYSSITQKQQVLMLFLIEIILIVLIGSMMTYGPEANTNLLKNHTGQYTIYIYTYMHRLASKQNGCTMLADWQDLSRSC